MGCSVRDHLIVRSNNEKLILPESQKVGLDEIATLRVYINKAVKRTVVIKEDDLLTRKELVENAPAVATATKDELQTWLLNKCFDIVLFKDAENIMTSRYVAKWKFVKIDGVWKRIIRMRLVLRGFMDSEAYYMDTFAGTARRESQRILASEAACRKDWIIASLDIDKAFLKGLTYVN